MRLSIDNKYVVEEISTQLIMRIILGMDYSYNSPHSSSTHIYARTSCLWSNPIVFANSCDSMRYGQVHQFGIILFSRSYEIKVIEVIFAYPFPRNSVSVNTSNSA